MLPFIKSKTPHRCLYMLQDRRRAAVLPLHLFLQKRIIPALFYQLTHSPNDPKRLVGITCIIIGIPGEYAVTIPKLMPQAFNDLFLRLFLPIVQKGDSNLKIIPHTFLSHNAKIHLFLHPVIHDMVYFLIWCSNRQGTELLVIVLFSFLKFPFCHIPVCISGHRLSRVLT